MNEAQKRFFRILYNGKSSLVWFTYAPAQLCLIIGPFLVH